MNTTEKLTRRVIELIHGEPWEEAIKKEQYWLKGDVECIFDVVDCYSNLDGVSDWGEMANACIAEHYPITIGRILQAVLIHRKFEEQKISRIFCGENSITTYFDDWELSKDTNQEATAEDQSEETNQKLLKLLT